MTQITVGCKVSFRAERRSLGKRTVTDTLHGQVLGIYRVWAEEGESMVAAVILPTKALRLVPFDDLKNEEAKRKERKKKRDVNPNGA